MFIHAHVSMIAYCEDVYRSRPIGASLSVGVVNTRLAAARLSGSAASTGLVLVSFNSA